jgi:hypothetical protein
MDPTVILFTRKESEPGRHALVLLDAARDWRRYPAGDAPVSDAVVRQLGAAGLLGALAPLDGLMLVISVHAGEPLHLGRPGEPSRSSDARLLAWLFDQAVRDCEVSEDAVDRLALRVDIGARALLCAALRRLAGAARPRVERGVWPASETRWRPDDDLDGDLDADPGPDPARLLAAE